MPDFVKTYNASSQKLTIVGVNMNDTPEEVKNFMTEFKVPYPIVIDNTGDLVYKYRVRGHPTTIFINRQGVITGIIAGLATPQILEQEIDKALK